MSDIHLIFIKMHITYPHTNRVAKRPIIFAILIPNLKKWPIVLPEMKNELSGIHLIFLKLHNGYPHSCHLKTAEEADVSLFLHLKSATLL